MFFVLKTLDNLGLLGHKWLKKKYIYTHLHSIGFSERCILTAKGCVCGKRPNKFDYYIFSYLSLSS